MLNREYVLYNLREAALEIERTIAELGAGEHFDVGQLYVSVQHAYHHINTAWNAREATPQAAEACSAEDFSRWRRFPADDFEMSAE